MRFYNKHSTFEYSWNDLAAAFWQRYPNPFATHVKSEDTVQRVVKGSKLYSTRLISKSSKMPKWGEMIVSAPKQVFVVEESIVDRDNKTITMYTRQIGYTNMLSVIEKCIYSIHPEQPKWMLCDRSAWIDSKVYGFSYAVQKFGFERYKQSAAKQVKGFNHVLMSIYQPELLQTQTIPEKLKEKREKVIETAHMKKEQLKERREKVIETAHMKKEQLKERREKVIETAHVKKEQLKERREKVIETAHMKKEQLKNKAKEFKPTPVYAQCSEKVPAE